ncbi:threonine ammonia-lyase [Horticoccus sp. 23ND18S-11]|uniref:threonine ammonia-lyase n=1 Tax=Horticoccus sp. 23ND18S-11 TaxID=3391832 RepID=UPI0039C9B44E
MNSALHSLLRRLGGAGPALSLADVVAARRRLAHGVRLTPCVPAPALSDLTCRRIWLKRDDLQRTGSFKERGARHALLCLDASARARGVVAASAGNHALGLAYHGAQLGVAVTVVMPVTAPAVKIARCRSLGADVVLEGSGFEAAQRHAETLAATTGATLVHPFDDLRVIAGQGTMALEILEQAPELDTIVVPVGGGGLLAGVITVVKALRPDVRVVAVEPEAATGFRAAWRHGAPIVEPPGRTLADGLAVARVGTKAFALAAARVDDVVTVTESELGAALALLARTCGAVVEGAGAAALAAVLAGKVAGRACVLPIGGRNIDASVHAAVLTAHPERIQPVQARPAAATLAHAA